MDKKNIQKVIDIKDEEYLNIELINQFAYESDQCNDYAKMAVTPYSNIIFVLLHEKLSEHQAKKLWKHLRNHMEYLEKELKRKVGIVVATGDYLNNIAGKDKSFQLIDEEMMDDLAEFSIKDKLTDLFTRDIFDIFIVKEFDEAKRKNLPVAYAMFDIDDFKHVNDRYGHQTGDEVLKKIGSLINQNIREMDMAVRYGGEEFGVIFPNTDKKSAEKISERIRKKVESEYRGGMGITVSCGIADSKKADSAQELIMAADKALYRVKQEGKNSVRTD